MANYGIPYMGSKGSIVHRITTAFPGAENFYDLFGGGFSVSHFMLLHRSREYKRFFYNDPTPGLAGLIQDAIAGKYNYNRFQPPWISREDFKKNKDHCAYTRIIWSFGNNQYDYLFGADLEADKRSLHNAVVFNEFDDTARSLLKIRSFQSNLSIRGRRLLCRSLVIKNKHFDKKQLQQLLQLERLQQLERLDRLEFSSKSYEQVLILPNSVIYCDPPYENTAGYLSAFNHGQFWRWAINHTSPVFVSEYEAPKEMTTVMALHKKTRLSAKGTTATKPEKLFCNPAAVSLGLSSGRV